MNYSNFPDNIDYSSDESYLSDLTYEDWQKIFDYNNAIQNEKTDVAEEILNGLKGKHITADDINKLIDCIRNIEIYLYPIIQGKFKGGKIYGVSQGDAEENIPIGFNGNDTYVNADGDTFFSPKFEENGESLEEKYLQQKDLADAITEIEDINAATLNGKYDTYFAKASHAHTKSEISDFPLSLKNPYSLSVDINGTKASYDGSSFREIKINPNSVGATTQEYVENHFLAATNGKEIDTSETENPVVFKGNDGQISMLDNEIQGDSYSKLTNFDEIYSSNFYGDLYNANNVESQKVKTSEVNIDSSIKLVYDSNSESLNFIFT